MLEQIVQQRPDDPFPRYGLAMELKKVGRHADARSAFETLIEAHADYLPSYLMAGNLLVEMGDADAARATLDAGIDRARAAGDGHTLGELEAARSELA